MLNTMPVAVAVLHPVKDSHGIIAEFVYMFANKIAEKMAGETLYKKRFFLNQDALLFNNMASVAESGKREDFLYHYQKEPEKWIHYSISRFGDGVMLTYENFTERKKAAMELMGNKARMDMAQAIGHTGSFDWDVVANTFYWSDEMFRIHGMKPQSEVITQEKILGLIHPEDMIRIKKKMEHYSQLPGQEEILYKLKLKDGGIRHMRALFESFRGKSGKITHLSGMTQDITARKNTEEELRIAVETLKKQTAGKDKREAKLDDYQRIVDSAHDAIVSFDRNGIITTWNQAAEKLYKFTAAEAIGRKVLTLLIPERMRKDVEPMLAKVFDGESMADVETVKSCRGGGEIDVLVNIVPLKDGNGKVNGAAATSKNIGETHRAQQEILKLKDELAQRAEDKYRTLFETIDEGFTILELVRDKNGKAVDWIYREVNGSFEKLTGFENPLGKTVSEMMPDVDQFWMETYSRVADTGKSERLENYVAAVDRWYTLHVSRVGGEGSQLVAVLFDDITQRKKAESETELLITEQNKFIQSMTTATPDIMYVMEINTKHVNFATKSIACEMGYSEKQIKAMKEPFLDIMHPEDVPFMLEHIDKMRDAEDGEVREILYRLVHADGSHHWFIDRNTVFKRDKDGVPKEKMGITQNVNARVNSEDQIHSLNKSLTEKNRELRSLNSELKTFTTIAAYDYKDTLQNLYTNLEYIISREAQNLSNTGKANLRKAQTAIQKMKLLTDDIVEFSKIRTPDEKPASVDLDDIFANVMDELNEKIQASGAVIEKEKMPSITGYPFLLDLLFWHLLDNAIKFRYPDKTPHILIRHHISTERGTTNGLHQITITDNGIGFPQEEAARIFQMFYRIHDKKYKGSGIGLAICKKITDLHGGTMAVESQPGKGTSICCFFPV